MAESNYVSSREATHSSDPITVPRKGGLRSRGKEKGYKWEAWQNEDHFVVVEITFDGEDSNTLVSDVRLPPNKGYALHRYPNRLEFWGTSDIKLIGTIEFFSV